MKDNSSDRHGEAAKAAKAAIEAKRTSVGSAPKKINAKEMGMSDYGADGFTKVRINGKK